MVFLHKFSFNSKLDGDPSIYDEAPETYGILGRMSNKEQRALYGFWIKAPEYLKPALIPKIPEEVPNEDTLENM